MSTSQPTRRRAEHVKRTAPEWITFAVSALILIVVVVVLVVLATETEKAASPVAAQRGSVRHVGDQYLVPVEVKNRGDESAAEVQVLAELTIDGVTTSGDQVIDFLGGGETQHITFVFAGDPAAGELSITVTGFADP